MDEFSSNGISIRSNVVPGNSLVVIKLSWTSQFRLPENKVDVVISGLGFVTIHCPNALIEVKAPEQVGVFIREALI